MPRLAATRREGKKTAQRGRRVREKEERQEPGRREKMMIWKSSHKYDDIMDLPHPTSDTHPRMSLYDRAAQFSPFAALTGHGEAVRETARLTEEEAELDEDVKARLDETLRAVREKLKSGMAVPVTMTYFEPDKKKDGGAYVSLDGNIKKVDEHERAVVMEDGTVIPVERIASLCVAAD